MLFGLYHILMSRILPLLLRLTPCSPEANLLRFFWIVYIIHIARIVYAFDLKLKLPQNQVASLIWDGFRTQSIEKDRLELEHLNIKYVEVPKNMTHLFQPLGLKVVPATFLLVCFVCLKEGTFQARKNIFYLTSKALFVLKIIRF